MSARLPYPSGFGYVDEVIEPELTRLRLVRGLELLEYKRQTNPPRKHRTFRRSRHLPLPGAYGNKNLRQGSISEREHSPMRRFSDIPRAVLFAVAVACSNGDTGGGDHPLPVSVTVSVTGSGRVTSQPAGVDCASDISPCTWDFPADTVLDLDALPDTDALFGGWGEGCAGVTTPTCRVTLSSDVSVTAQFAGVAADPTLTVNVAGGGRVTSSPAGIDCPGSACSARFAAGAHVTLAPALSNDQTLSGWSGACTGKDACVVVMNTDEAVTATFTPRVVGSHTVVINFGGNGQGVVKSSPAGIDCRSDWTGACSAPFAVGTRVTLTSTPSNGSRFGGWNGASCGGSGSCVFTIADGDVPVSATFNSVSSSHILTVNVGGDGHGTVTSSPAGISCTAGSCSHDFGAGSGTVTLSVEPSAGSSFAGWRTGNCSGSPYARSCAVTLNNNGVGVGLDFSAWEPRNPFPWTLAGLATSGGRFLGVGKGGAAVTSFDGVAWTGHVLPTQATLHAVAVDGSGQFVAVADGGQVVRSTDLATFTVHGTPTTRRLNGIAYGGGAFVAVGNGGAVIRSTEGASWSGQTSGTTQDLLAITYGGGRFVAVGSGGTLLTSPDGTAWTSRTSSSGTTQSLASLAFDGARYVVVGDAGVVLTSPDAFTWTKQTAFTTTALRAVASSGALFVTAGEAHDGENHTTVWSSPDGVVWTAHDANLWSEPMLGFAYAEGHFYGLGSSGSITRSSDGASWSMALSPGGRDSPGTGAQTGLAAVAYGNGTFVAVGSNGSIFSSPDGRVWTARRAEVCCRHFRGVAFGAGVFVAIEIDGGGAASHTIYSSSDGISWTQRDATTTGGRLSDVTYGGGLFVAVGSRGAPAVGVVYTSPDGLTWTDRTSGASINSSLSSVAFGGGHFVVTGPSVISSSSDGVAWTLRMNATYYIVGVAYGNGTFVAFIGNNTFTSVDGARWRVNDIGYSVAGSNNNSLAFGNGQFLGSTLATSTDGVTWTRGQLPEGIAFADAVFVAGTGWVAVGANETFMIRAP